MPECTLAPILICFFPIRLSLFVGSNTDVLAVHRGWQGNIVHTLTSRKATSETHSSSITLMSI
jgi:hypothetical protein